MSWLRVRIGGHLRVSGCLVSALQSPPPIPVGLSSCTLPVGVASESAVPLLALETPFSNTGFCSGSPEVCLIDFLSVSVSLSALSEPDFDFVPALPRDQRELAIAMAQCPVLAAQTIFNLMFYGSAIEAVGFTPKGLFGYTHSSALRVLGVEGQVGVMAIGGNGNTVYISLSGAGMAWIRNLRKVAIALQSYGATITRVDLAFDDFHGEFFDMPWVCDLARAGFFDADNGNCVKRSKIDDLGSLRGSSLYIGKKGVKEFNLYEKGKQLQSPNAAWIRGEGRLWSKNRVIPYEVLTRPMAFMRGEFPAMASFMPFRGAAKRCDVMQAIADATYEGAERWLLHAAGKTINFMRRAGERADEHPTELVNKLSRDGTPGRFVGIPEEVAFKRVERLLGRMKDVFDLPDIEREEMHRLSFENQGV